MLHETNNLQNLGTAIKISIIVPIYNVEKYINRCIESLLIQNFSDFEIILVDDGSTDRSGLICDEYAVNDNRVKVIHKKNGGVASARQTGVNIASGEYIIHVDPDDWVDSEMLKQMYSKAKEADADVTICDFYITDGRGKDTLLRQKPSSLDPHSIMLDIVLKHKLHGSLCNKLTKRSCYIKYGLNFTPGIDYCEDVLIWVQLFHHQNVKVTYLGKAFYHYFKGNSESITHSTKPEIIESTCRYYKKLDSLLSVQDKYIANYEWLNFYYWLWHIHYYNAKDFRNKGLSNNLSSV